MSDCENVAKRGKTGQVKFQIFFLFELLEGFRLGIFSNGLMYWMQNSVNSIKCLHFSQLTHGKSTKFPPNTSHQTLQIPVLKSITPQSVPECNKQDQKIFYIFGTKSNYPPRSCSRLLLFISCNFHDQTAW